MNRYRQTMTFTIDVWAKTEEEATNSASDVFFYMSHEWFPETTILDEDDQTFSPINEREDMENYNE